MFVPLAVGVRMFVQGGPHHLIFLHITVKRTDNYFSTYYKQVLRCQIYLLKRISARCPFKLTVKFSCIQHTESEEF